MEPMYCGIANSCSMTTVGEELTTMSPADVKAYLKQYELSEIISNAVNDAVAARSTTPVEFIVEWLTSYSARESKKAAVSKGLAKRHSIDELKEVGILKSGLGISPALVESQQSLQKEMTKDALEKGLLHRPDVTTLQGQGIIKSSPGVSPAIVESREALQKEMTKDAVEKRLSRRISIDEMQEKGIYKSPVAAAGEVLQKEMNKDVLEKSLANRLENGSGGKAL